MTMINSYDLQRAVANKFVPSMESEQEIEIQTEEVVINQITSIDTEVEEVAEDTATAIDASEKHDDIENTEATLEALIASMESSILTGGYDVRSASIANIALESIANQYRIDAPLLTFGLEASAEDGEAETKSTIAKAKGMLGALKENAGVLINKMYNAAAAALGSTVALSEKLLAKASQISANINKANKGGQPVKLPKGVFRKLTLDGTTALAADKYLGELKRLTDKYNEVVKIYADSNVLTQFSNDVLKGMSTGKSQTSSNKAIMATVKALSSGIDKPLKGSSGLDEATSTPYLGGARITLKRPNMAMFRSTLLKSSSNEAISQEAMPSAVRVVLGGMLTVFGFLGAVGHGSSGLLSVGAGVAVFLTGAPLLGLVFIGQGLIYFAIAVLFSYGYEKGIEMLKNPKENAEELREAGDRIAKDFDNHAQQASVLSTEFDLETVSMEADEGATQAMSLNAGQIKTLTGIVINTAGTTRTMKAELQKRKALAKSIDEIAKKTQAAEDKDGGATIKAARKFINSYIKNTVKFEMQLTSYTVAVMRAALVYAEASNASDEKKTVA